MGNSASDYQVKLATERDVNRKNAAAMAQMEANHRAEIGEIRKQISALTQQVNQQRLEINSLKGQVMMMAATGASRGSTTKAPTQ